MKILHVVGQIGHQKRSAVWSFADCPSQTGLLDHYRTEESSEPVLRR
jgi:hypothetical protein